MIHLIKLAVGAKDAAQLAAWQAGRLKQHGALRHQTRMAPKRADELLAGGSLYWVIAGMALLRQRVIAVEPDTREDGTACTALRLDPVLVPLTPRAVRAFQGWRYLKPEDAPADLIAGAGDPAIGELPPALRQALQALALL